MKNVLKFAVLLDMLSILLLVTVACGGGQASGAAPTTGAPSGATQAAPSTGIDPATAATINGKVNFGGTAPQPKKIDMSAEPGCAQQYPDGATTEDVIVNSNNTLQNVFVYVKDGLGGKTFPAPSQAVLLDQKGCRYIPHVFGVQVNQNIDIRNSDNNLHNIHPRPKINKEFNQGQPRQGMVTTKSFDKPEVMIPVFCEIHSWMNGYIAVLDNAFFAVSGADGTFSIKGLPPGDYTLEAIHEEYGTQTMKVTVAAKDTKQVDFTFKAP